MWIFDFFHWARHQMIFLFNRFSRKKGVCEWESFDKLLFFCAFFVCISWKKMLWSLWQSTYHFDVALSFVYIFISLQWIYSTVVYISSSHENQFSYLSACNFVNSWFSDDCIMYNVSQFNLASRAILHPWLFYEHSVIIPFYIVF